MALLEHGYLGLVLEDLRLGQLEFLVDDVDGCVFLAAGQWHDQGGDFQVGPCRFALLQRDEHGLRTAPELERAAFFAGILHFANGSECIGQVDWVELDRHDGLGFGQNVTPRWKAAFNVLRLLDHLLLEVGGIEGGIGGAELNSHVPQGIGTPFDLAGLCEGVGPELGGDQGSCDLRVFLHGHESWCVWVAGFVVEYGFSFNDTEDFGVSGGGDELVADVFEVDAGDGPAGAALLPVRERGEGTDAGRQNDHGTKLLVGVVVPGW